MQPADRWGHCTQAAKIREGGHARTLHRIKTNQRRFLNFSDTSTKINSVATLTSTSNFQETAKMELLSSEHYEQVDRLASLVQSFEKRYGQKPAVVVRVPGLKPRS